MHCRSRNKYPSNDESARQLAPYRGLAGFIMINQTLAFVSILFGSTFSIVAIVIALAMIGITFGYDDFINTPFGKKT